MCGLVGILTPGQASNQHLKLLANMLYVDQLRGEHATGVAKINTASNQVAIHKRAVNANQYLASADTMEFLDKQRGRIYIGHNRYATMGNKGDDANAHPFQYKHITMAHNGTVDSWTLNKLEGHKELAVDSNMVCATIAERGFEEAVKSFSGAFALVWWDANLRTLNFVRNNERPLWNACLTDGSLVWASQPEFIDFWISQQKCTLSYSKGGEPTSIPENVWITYSFSETGLLLNNGTPSETDVVFTKVVDPNPPRYPATRYNDWWRNADLDDIEDYHYQGSRNVSNGNVRGRQTEKDRIEGLFRKYKLDVSIGDKIAVTVKSFASCTGHKDRVNVYCDYDGVEAVLYYVPKLLVEGATRLEAPVTLITETSVPTGFGGVRNVAKLTLNANQCMRVVTAPVTRKAANFPLQVIGHRFADSTEFSDFVGCGCAICGTVPLPNNPMNVSMKVYPGDEFTGLIEGCEFICGKCVEEKLDVIDV